MAARHFPLRPTRIESPCAAPAMRVRIARATHQLEQVVAFYLDGLGLGVVERFEGHAGYAGVILKLPGGAQLEFTQHESELRTSMPDADDLLVLYLPSSAAVEKLRKRIERLGHVCVRPGNPYWVGKSVTFEDPDGWRVVLCNSAAL
jgi:catechol 2,3-dioxygenase-like lactoylglutathione lyase family enzyme